MRLKNNSIIYELWNEAKIALSNFPDLGVVRKFNTILGSPCIIIPVPCININNKHVQHKNRCVNISQQKSIFSSARLMNSVNASCADGQ